MARRRQVAPAIREPAIDVPVPPWARKDIERGRYTLEEYQGRHREWRRERIADLIDRVPPAVEREGPEAVTAWAEEWDALDPRVSVARVDAGNDPRAPLRVVAKRRDATSACRWPSLGDTFA
jgi:hypothetical protein